MPKSDQHYMSLAVQAAQNGQGCVEPNPMVGCVIVADGQVIGLGWHEKFGGPHAEINAIASVKAEHKEKIAGATALAPYLKRTRTGLPWVIAKWAMTIDGSIATASGDSQWISGEKSRKRVHDLRRRVDAVLVGIGTALADDPMLNPRPAGKRTVTRVVVDSAVRLPLDSKLSNTKSTIA